MKVPKVDIGSQVYLSNVRNINIHFLVAVMKINKERKKTENKVIVCFGSSQCVRFHGLAVEKKA